MRYSIENDVIHFNGLTSEPHIQRNYMADTNAPGNLLKKKKKGTRNLYNRYLTKKAERRLHYMRYAHYKKTYTCMHS